ncbi:hypothetical protein EDC02_5010 [Micromonospora sp. Llam0]|uniref:hypothetical protein n=1 Tax=Micromonospora sp. Llam0 TaxID=2485143 RepID=UPI000F48C759|nr:hypothetical protein [Micromonospora sp. Llam0]ROO63001.1 hypothetical protein EDC02_5010 [Micromonospora sp. Llam0]
MSGNDDKDRITRLQLRYMLADGVLTDMDTAELLDVAAAGGVPVRPGMGERELRDAIRASNAARARAAGVPIDHLPALTARQAYDLASQLSGEPALLADPESPHGNATPG